MPNIACYIFALSILLFPLFCCADITVTHRLISVGEILDAYVYDYEFTLTNAHEYELSSISLRVLSPVIFPDTYILHEDVLLSGEQTCVVWNVSVSYPPDELITNAPFALRVEAMTEDGEAFSTIVHSEAEVTQ